jgi:HlyD family secretion protein
MNRLSHDTAQAVRRHILGGTIGAAALVCGVGGWAATAEFSGAVITSGFLVVESDVKKVQHPTGGVVGELLVKEGDQVAAGDVLVRLDETVARANLAIITKALDESAARRARLEAERDGATAVAFLPDVLARAALEPEIAWLVAGERKLFETRHVAREGQKSQLSERIGQLEEQIQGLDEQIAAKTRELELINQELGGVRELWQKKLVPIQRVMVLERELVRIQGERGTLVSSVAQCKGKITETRLQLLQIDQDLRTEVSRELAEIRGKVSELVERKISAEDLLRRVDIRAPQDGTVHQLAVHTVGGVVGAGETVMMVVPAADHLAVEAKLAPQDRDQTHLGQRATLRFSAFNQRTTPEIDGEVSRISADITTDARTGQGYYTTRLKVPPHELARLGDVKLAPGMPVEVFVKTQARTVLSYFTKPLTDQVARAFREK